MSGSDPILIDICPTCETPLISTMAFMGAEKYCTGCGESSDIFGGREVPLTKALETQHKSLKGKFDKIYADMVPPGCFFGKCEKCQSKDEYHRTHMTDEERAKDKAAREALQNMLLPAHRS